jgi:hypothetical protein
MKPRSAMCCQVNLDCKPADLNFEKVVSGRNSSEGQLEQPLYFAEAILAFL